MRCKEFDAGLEIWIDGEAEAKTATAMTEHAGSCPDCAALLVARRAERESFRDLLTAEPPAEMREVLLTGEPVRRLPHWQSWTLAAAALLLLALGLNRLLPDPATPQGGPVLAYLDGSWESQDPTFESGVLELSAAPGHLSAGQGPAEGGSR
ncbi:MAG: hypothetical protein GY946_12985 [bacterium]|nr:hypothetical protein [bacterium]